MRNISFFLTTQQFIDGTKDVTRRLGWTNTKRGTHLMAVEKGQGIKKGGLVRLGEIVIMKNEPEPLKEIIERPNRMYGPLPPLRETYREGFPEMTPQQFVDFFCKHNHSKKRPVTPGTIVNRIEFARVRL